MAAGTSKVFSRLPKRRTIVQVVSISVIVLGVAAILLAFYVYFQAVKTFEVRRVSLPTRIFTDLTPLRSGEPLSLDGLREKLQRLGYREKRSLERPGDFYEGDGKVHIFLRPFKHPSGDQEAARVHLLVGESALGSVTSDEGVAVDNAALEPELLTSILGDQLENRSPVTLEQVPQHMVDAVIVTEDSRFWRHPGVDPIGILRAGFRNLRAGGVAEGGSTLTQQLVKNYYLTSERTMRRKIVEAFMSVILDAKYSKKEILAAYLNDIYLGRNRSISVLGVGEAARFYFGKPISEVNIAEAALLAGMIRSPNNYSPFANPKRAEERRKIVLDLLARSKRINDAEYKVALRQPLPQKPYREKTGLGSIPFYVDQVLRELQRDYGIDDVKGRGLQVYTAIDLEWQDLASRSLDAGLGGLEKSSQRLRRSDSPLEGAMIAVDLDRGEIRALVGGRNYQKSQFNRAVAAKRQVGSLFKPFVFLAAFEPSLSELPTNITPATLVNDTRFVFKRKYGKDWSPRNYNEAYYGVVTVRRALEQSLNVASVRIGLSTGIEPIIKTARALGIETELEAVPSLILGSVEIPPIEMAEAYSTIARMGSRIPLRSIRFILDDRGNQVADAVNVEAVQVFPARDVFLAVHLMEGVVDRGTGAGIRALGFQKTAAGKTGTTNDKRDAWFIGFTPQTLTLTWLGFDDNDPIGLSGSESAVPIWTRFMKAATVRERDREFPVPRGIVFVPVDSTSGGLATVLCPENVLVNEAFKAGTEPMTPCPIHREQLPPLEPIFEEPMDPADILAPDRSGLPPIDILSPPARVEPSRAPTQTAFPPVTQTVAPEPAPAPEPRPADPPATNTNPPE